MSTSIMFATIGGSRPSGYQGCLIVTRSLVQYEKGLLPRPLAVLIAFAMGAVPGWAAAVDAGAVALEPVEASFNSAFLVGRTQGREIGRASCRERV